MFFREVKNLPQLGASGLGVIRGSNYLNNLVDVENCDEQTLYQVQAGFALVETITRAPRDDLDAVVYVDAEKIQQPEGLWLAFHQRHGVDRETLLERCEPVELLKQSSRIETTLHPNNEAQAMVSVGQVGHVADPHELLRVDSILDLVDDPLGSDKVGKFCDHQTGFAGTEALDAHGRSSLEASFTGLVSLQDSLEPDNRAARGQVGSGNKRHQVLERGVGVVDQVARRIDDLAHVVGGHVGGHSHCNTASPIDQQVGESRR